MDPRTTSDTHTTPDTRRRATLWFWALVTLTVALVGTLSRELAAPAGPLTGVAVAVTGLLIILALAQAARLMMALTGSRRRPQA